ncbi:hypothetical protein [Amycolatopsis sp. NPDC051061]|uniref:hypothetical protein n=1 Tax=Amycolatopsis sp. NPDC051061 TaxID=3155042 RepID=UPI003432FE42
MELETLMAISDNNAYECPIVRTLLVVRDDETGWAHVAYDIDPRRKPRAAGFIMCESENAVLTGMAAAGFRLSCAYRVDQWSIAFLFERAAAPVVPVLEVVVDNGDDHDNAELTSRVSTARSLRLVQ